MGNRHGILAAGVLAALLLTLVAPAPAWAGGADDPAFTSATWVGWLRGLLTDIREAPGALLRLIGHEGLGLGPNGTPAAGADSGSVQLDGEPGLTNLIGREGPCMDPDGAPSVSCTEGAMVPTAPTSLTEPRPAS